MFAQWTIVTNQRCLNCNETRGNPAVWNSIANGCAIALTGKGYRLRPGGGFGLGQWVFVCSSPLSVFFGRTGRMDWIISEANFDLFDQNKCISNNAHSRYQLSSPTWHVYWNITEVLANWLKPVPSGCLIVNLLKLGAAAANNNFLLYQPQKMLLLIDNADL